MSAETSAVSQAKPLLYPTTSPPGGGRSVPPSWATQEVLLAGAAAGAQCGHQGVSAWHRALCPVTYPILSPDVNAEVSGRALAESHQLFRLQDLRNLTLDGGRLQLVIMTSRDRNRPWDFRISHTKRFSRRQSSLVQFMAFQLRKPSN